LNHLRFAHDTGLRSSDKIMMKKLHGEMGLKINLNKTNIMSRDDLHITIDQYVFDTVEEYECK